MPDLTYRPAARADLNFMVALIVADDVGTPSDDPANSEAPEYLAALEAIDADPNQRLYIAELEGRPIGTFQLTFVPGIMRKGMRRGIVESAHIVPEARSKGHGGEMMRFAIAVCRENGCGMVQLTSNKLRLDAHRFYRRLGFAQSHEGFRLFLSTPTRTPPLGEPGLSPLHLTGMESGSGKDQDR